MGPGSRQNRAGDQEPARETRGGAESRADLARRALPVLAEADQALAGRSCPKSGDCCQLGETGREPFLTWAEWEVIAAELARQGRRVPGPREDLACVFLTGEGRCSIYAARPLGCRTYYCHRATGPRPPRRLLNDIIRRLEVMSGDPDFDGRPLTTWLNRARRSS